MSWRKDCLSMLTKIFCRDCLLSLLVIVGVGVSARPTWYFLQRSYVDYYAKKSWAQEIYSSKAELEVDRPVAWLKIAEADVDTLVLKGASKDNLSRFPACETSFSDPGTLDLTIILGHRDSHFKKLDQLREGSELKIQDLSGQWLQYSVAKTQVVDKEDVIYLLEGEQGLLLMTCYPLMYVGEAPQRYLVWAKLNQKKKV